MTIKYEAVKRWRQRTKARAVAFLGGCCRYCGYNKCLRALQFHHKDRMTKKLKRQFGMIQFFHNWERIKEELEKCELLCANCHAEEEERRDS